MRQARRTADGRWHMVEQRDGMSLISPLVWERDQEGRWPLVEFHVRSLGEGLECPNCGESWTLEEIDCVFGTACRRGNDLLLQLRCGGCRLPHRVRATGFVTAYPRLLERMQGWADWERRERLVRACETELYGDQEREPV